ncbi:MAG TPA: NACHT domain-containing protein, partial [Anaerolineae bacterium]|nr:NACHT domain-containing protein [Anaerolineae bacterium]
ILLSSQAADDLMPVAARRADERAYLTALLVNSRYGRWDTRFVPLAGTITTFERPPGWTDIPPEFTLLEIHGQGPGRQVRRTRLEDITQATALYDALVLLGEPGAGKTTVLYKLALDAAHHRLTTGEGRLPLYLPLAGYRDYPSPHAFVEATWRQHLGGGDLDDRLRRGDLFLLVDGLNEMPFRDERDYRARVGAWRRFVSAWPGNKILFTCRSRDYGEPLGLHQVEIERLDDARVRDFLRKYLAEDLARETWERLECDPLLELVRNPYYLSMLAYILAGGGAWPANRAAMFHTFVDLLLTREQARGHPDWPGKEPLEEALSSLAESIQPMGQGTRLERREFLARIPSQVEGPDGPVDTPPKVVLRLGLAATLLDTERSPAGEEQVRFYHHQLQEYFAARAWLRGEEAESGAMKQMMYIWQAVQEDPALLAQLRRAGASPREIAALEQLSPMEERQVQEVLGKIYAERPRDRPAFWDDERYNNPAQPVVGVTWFEAVAYCHWLREQLKVSGYRFQIWRDGQPETLNLEPETLTVRLPTEAEWEKAARMNRGWIYPWGNRWDAGRANTWEGHVLHPTPVGVYPRGATPEGVHDLAGNVWEWTSSLYRPYPYRADDGREDPEAGGPRVVRGGSWGDLRWYARCASRDGNFLDYFGGGLGFRVVVSLALPSSEF